METHRCLTVLRLLGIRIRQRRLAPITLITPVLAHLIEFYRPIKIIKRFHSRMLLRRIIEKISYIGINIHQPVHSGPDERQLRTCGILVDCLHLRMICHNIVCKLFYFFKGINRIRNACFCCNVTTIYTSVRCISGKKCRNRIQFIVYGCLLQCRFRLHCIVIRRISGKHFVQCHKCTSLCKTCKTKPSCAVCHIKFFAR